MSTLPQPSRIAFGRFELNVQERELRNSGVRVRLPDQPFQILVLLASRPGEIVSREELREQIWSDGTFVDFENGLYAAMNRLRRVLGDNADHPRYIETVPGRGYRFIGTLESIDLPPAVDGKEWSDAPAAKSRRVRIWPWAAGAVTCVASAALGWFLHVPPPPPVWTVTRITSDAGLSSSPAISLDGKLIAYSSEAPDGATDLYVKQVTGGAPIRLTFDGAGNTDPDFSPDSGTIVFRSNRNGGGIYEIPTFGGQVRFIAKDGQNPRFSPDGSRIAYWIGNDAVALAVPGSGTLWVVPRSGGQPQQVGANLTAARLPIWSPNGRQLLAIGYSSSKAYESSAVDWWLAPIDGSPAVRTSAYEAFARFGLRRNSMESGPDSGSEASMPSVPRPVCWSAKDNSVTFSAVTTRSNTFNIWRTNLSPRAWKVTGSFTRITTGSGNEQDVSCAATDVVAFTGVDIRNNIWTLAGDLNAGTVSGALTRLTDGPARHEYPSIARDGRQLVFASAQLGTMSIWKRDLTTGAEGEVANSTFTQRFPVISGSGERVAFSVYEKGVRSVYVSARGGTAEKVCDDCLRATDWSRDERNILVFSGNPYKISVQDTATRRQTLLLKHASHQLLYARYSPDERWVSFTERVQPHRSRIVIAAIDAALPVAESAWIVISDAGLEDWASWSPDGKTLYFTSDRDGHSCLWGQRLDVKSHRPVGAPFAVQHLHGSLYYQSGGWSANGGLFTLSLMERSGNIWMMVRSNPQ